MKRTVYAARTAFDLKHVNRFGVPEFGILDLRVAASNKTSQFFQPPDAPAPKTAESGVADFHFVPEKETVEIRYEIEDRFVFVDGAKFEFFTRFEEAALWTLDLKDLGEDWWAHGKHVIKWDGRLVKPTAKQAATKTDKGLQHDLTTIDVDKTNTKFADGYVTLEHTPYKLRLTLSSTNGAGYGNPAQAWTFYQILLKSIELELGKEEMVPAVTVDDDEHKRNKALRTVIADLPDEAQTAAKKIFLISNIFKTAGGQMNDNTAFTAYKTLWEDGPKIPIVAKIRLSASDDSEVKIDETDKGAVALGKVKFLWDWEDPDEDVAGQQTLSAPPVTFINSAINYYKAGTDQTYPKGDNCHKDRGGKRGPGAAAIFPPQPGYDAKDTLDAGKLPFKVEASTERKWAALSEGWTTGIAKGKTGVVFSPSRMAGDDYKITVYLAYDKSDKDKLALNIKDEPLKAAIVLKKATGKFQVWRELHISRYIRKKNTIPDFVAANLGAICSNYSSAYVKVVDNMGGADRFEVPTANYTTIAAGKLTTAGNEILNLAVDPAADHSSTASTFLVRDYTAFKAALDTSLLGTGVLPPGLGAARTTWLTNKKCTTNRAYVGVLNELLKGPAKAVVKDLNTLNGAPSGITVIQFDHLDSYKASLVAGGTSGLGGINGAAIDVPGNARDKCCFILWNPQVDTFVHEIGHHLFLPHFGPKPDAFVANAHDSADLACIMTYNRPRPAFCGFCQLRIRGWDKSALNSTGANNTKP